MDISIKDVILVGIGIFGGGIIGGIITYVIAKTVVARSKICFSLRIAVIFRKTEFGRTFQMLANDRPLDNVCVFNFSISLKGPNDISKNQIQDDNKPTLFFPDFIIYDVRTIENDQSRFDIPLGRRGSLLIININRLRSNTHARFQIIGTFNKNDFDLEKFQADFHPGSILNVDVESAGLISKPWRKNKVIR